MINLPELTPIRNFEIIIIVAAPEPNTANIDQMKFPNIYMIIVKIKQALKNNESKLGLN